MNDTLGSARKIDLNGYVNIDRNPISRAGIFQYLGSSIDKDANPNQVYNVYRPEEELLDPECIESFKLNPLVDDHTMLGPEESGLVPAEYKGVHGTTGENVVCENGVLYSNLKIFSTSLANMINNGKRDLSLGYRCVYSKVSGFFNGQPYDYIQRKLRGNHLALVDQARCAVAVLDHQLAFDHFDLALDMGENKMAEEDKDAKTGEGEMTLTEAVAMLKKIMPQVEALTAAAAGSKTDEELAVDEASVKPSVKPGGGGTGVTDEEEKAKAEKEAKDAEEEKKDKEEKKGMDAAIGKLTGEFESFKKSGIKSLVTEIKARDALAEKLSAHVGTFDASDKTLSEVAVYGVEKLGIKCPKGHEQTALDAYLLNRSSGATAKSFSFDSAAPAKGGKLDAFLKKHAA